MDGEHYESSDDRTPVIAMARQRTAEHLPSVSRATPEGFLCLDECFMVPCTQGHEEAVRVVRTPDGKIFDICAVYYCDIDCYNKDLGYYEVLGVVKVLSESGQLPWPLQL